MNYQPILEQLDYWQNYNGYGDEYRKTHDRDCILTGGNLFADTVFSLWLPLRYTLNFFDVPQWIGWKKYESTILQKKKMGLKKHKDFIEDLKQNIEIYLPIHEITENLIKLFVLGQKRCNVMILPYRHWNTKRGFPPYFDYLPHFLYDLLDTEDLKFKNEVVSWIRDEHLLMFFKDAIVEKNAIFDLAGTGCAYKHSPAKIQVLFLLKSYIKILEQRERVMSVA